jgi:hypothetical protein
VQTITLKGATIPEEFVGSANVLKARIVYPIENLTIGA